MPAPEELIPTEEELVEGRPKKPEWAAKFYDTLYESACGCDCGRMHDIVGLETATGMIANLNDDARVAGMVEGLLAATINAMNRCGCRIDEARVRETAAFFLTRNKLIDLGAKLVAMGMPPSEARTTLERIADRLYEQARDLVERAFSFAGRARGMYL
mgnify:CR=1 FL=1